MLVGCCNAVQSNAVSWGIDSRRCVLIDSTFCLLCPRITGAQLLPFIIVNQHYNKYGAHLVPFLFIELDLILGLTQPYNKYGATTWGWSFRCAEGAHGTSICVVLIKRGGCISFRRDFKRSVKEQFRSDFRSEGETNSGVGRFIEWALSLVSINPMGQIPAHMNRWTLEEGWSLDQNSWTVSRKDA